MTLRHWATLGVGLLGPLIFCVPAQGQTLGLDQPTGVPPVPIKITAAKGMEWNQQTRTITASGHAKAVRGSVTVTADRLVAHYVAKAATRESSSHEPDASGPLATFGSGQSQISELDAIGRVHIFTPSQQAFGEKAVYRMASGELVLTGAGLRLITPEEMITARKALEYWSHRGKAVAIGHALIVTKDHRSISADVLIGYFKRFEADPSVRGTEQQKRHAQGLGGQLRKVVAHGHVVLHTATDIATGDNAEYDPETGIAVLTGNVHITHGRNELMGARAQVDTKTGIATLTAATGARVQGLVIPNSATSETVGSPQSGRKAGGS